MVILQFNKLIRNKWIWGAFAVVVCLAFCFDDFFRGSRSDEGAGKEDAYGTLDGAPVDGALYRRCLDDVNFWLARDRREAAGEINKLAWKLYAAQVVARENGLAVSDESVSDFAKAYLRSLGMREAVTKESYERVVTTYFKMSLGQFEGICRRAVVAQMVGLEEYPTFGQRLDDESEGLYNQRRMMRLFALDAGRSVADATVWAAPMEVRQAVYDMTDKFEIRIAEFEQTPDEAAAVKPTDELLKAWYDEKRDTIQLPDLYQVRYVALDGEVGRQVARAQVTDEEIADYYRDNSDAYTEERVYPTNTADFASVTNKPDATVAFNEKGEAVVTTVKPLETVRGEIQSVLSLRKGLLAASDWAVSNLFEEVAEGEDVAKRFDRIVRDGAAEAAKPAVSGWFAKEGPHVEGFMVQWKSVVPGATDFLSDVDGLDFIDDDPLCRFAVVNATNTVYALELRDKKPAHLPTFDEAKGKIAARALEYGRAKAFREKVEAVIAQGKDAVLATKNVSTNMVFSGESRGDVPQAAVAAACKLAQGGVSEMIPEGKNKATVVVCLRRESGVEALDLRDRAAARLEGYALMRRRLSGRGWGECYLERAHAVPGQYNEFTVRGAAEEEASGESAVEESAGEEAAK